MSRIMIVDDDVTIQMELEEYLNHMDHTIVGIAHTGIEAVINARQTAPDLILMDINMPGEMDGISAARTIKEEMDVGVVFVTGYDNPEYIERAKFLEPFGYVMKPFDEKEINRVIEIALHNRKLVLDLKAAHERLKQNNLHLQEQMAERKRIEETRTQTLSQLQATLEATLDGIIVVGLDSRIRVVSKRFKKIWHVPDAILDSKDAVQAFDFILTQLTESKAFSNKTKAVSADPHLNTFDTLHLKNGRIFECYSHPQKLDNNIIGRVWAFRDVTEQKRLEEQLIQAQKLETISTLTGGIAHDYNNFLSIIMGNLSLAMEEVTPGSDLKEFLNRVDIASRKARDLTHEFMSLSEGGSPVKTMGSFKELLNVAVDAIPAHSGISLKEFIAQDLWPLPYDPYKMGAVFRNIITNAVEAMPHGGALTISARNFRFEDKNRHAALPLKRGNYVQVSIQDEGTGIPEKYLARIFDPYFSTKAMGVRKGMGLSLTTTYSIIKKHGGHINIDSSPDVGTTVNIYLPAESRQVEVDSPAPSKNISPSPVKRVLFMDDEEMLRTLLQLMLERLGYEAATVSDGAQAIALYKRQNDSGEPFDAVILDLTIKGGMGGEQTIRELLKIEPNIKAFVSSGYCHDPIMTDFESYGFRGAIPKPYHMEDLKKALSGI